MDAYYPENGGLIPRLNTYNPSGEWTSQHQMSLNGKTTDFVLDDLVALAKYADIKPARAKTMLDQVLAAANRWDEYVHKAEVPARLADGALAGFRLRF